MCIKAELVRHSPAAAHSAQAWSGRGPLGADFTGSFCPAARICSGSAMIAIAHSIATKLGCEEYPNLADPLGKWNSISDTNPTSFRQC